MMFDWQICGRADHVTKNFICQVVKYEVWIDNIYLVNMS